MNAIARLVPIIAGSFILLAGCQGNGSGGSSDSNGEPMSAATAELPPPATRPADFESPAPVYGVADLMQAKLLHTHTVLEAISLEDYAQVEHSALVLAWLSEQSDWRVHDTVAYATMSERFHRVADLMAADARDRNGDAVRDDYVLLIESCLECHTYLREEGLVKDMPGIVS